MKILVIQQKMIGDVLISSIICENIKLWNPKIEVDFLVNRHTIPVIENNPYIDNIIIFEDHKSDRGRNFLKFLKMHINKDYDVIIDAYGKIESIIITLLTNAKIKIGYKKWYTKWVYSILIDRKLRKSKAEIQLSILNRLKLLEPIVGKNFKFKLKPRIHLKQEREKNIDLISIKKKNILIMISVLGSSVIKSYPINKMATLLNYLVKKHPVKLILNYMPDQRDEIMNFLKKINPKTKEAIIKNKTPKSLRDYISTVSYCDAIIGNEGGAINIAKSLNIPSFSIFSPQIDPDVWNTECSKNVSVHIKDFNDEFKNFKLNENQIIRLYESFDFNYFKKNLSAFIRGLQ